MIIILEIIAMGIIIGAIFNFIFQNREEIRNTKPRSYKEFHELTGYGRLEYFANNLLLAFGAIGVIGLIFALLIGIIKQGL